MEYGIKNGLETGKQTGVFRKVIQRDTKEAWKFGICVSGTVQKSI